MPDPIYLNLQRGEEALAIAASNIFAAYIISGEAKEDPEGKLQQAALDAIRLARLVDDNVIVPGEMPN